MDQEENAQRYGNPIPYQRARVCTPPTLQTPFPFWQLLLYTPAAGPETKGLEKLHHPSEALREVMSPLFPSLTLTILRGPL